MSSNAGRRKDQNMAAAKVLVVDDEIEFANVIAERMRGRGYEVDTANSGADGMEKIKEKAYDAVLLDLSMPGLDGMETMKRMLDHDKQLQIIILTGYGSVQKGVEAVKQGAADFLEKPADIDALTGKIDEAYERRVAFFEENIEKKMSDLIKRKGW
jgi:DNA-binding NtrC family response regulator